MFDEAMDGVGIVIHLAARSEGLEQPGRLDAAWQVNVEGTRTNSAAARRSRLRQASRAGAHEQRRACTETPAARSRSLPHEDLTCTAPANARSAYRVGSRGGIAPDQLAGHDAEHLPAGRDLRPRKLPRAPAVSEHPSPQVGSGAQRGRRRPPDRDIDDVVHAILAILARPAPHETAFNIGGERPLQLQELRALQADVLGVLRHRFVLPTRPAPPLARLG